MAPSSQSGCDSHPLGGGEVAQGVCESPVAEAVGGVVKVGVAVVRAEGLVAAGTRCRWCGLGYGAAAEELVVVAVAPLGGCASR